jgi:DNA-binding Lrp family transcriptional regulator
MDPASTVREMAVGVGVTERAVVAILNQLEDEGIIVRQKRDYNTYLIDFAALRRAGHPATGRCRLGSWMWL